MANGERVMENGKFLVKAEFRVPCPGSIPISMAIPLAGNNMRPLAVDRWHAMRVGRSMAMAMVTGNWLDCLAFYYSIAIVVPAS